jgi:hypothetical protein
MEISLSISKGLCSAVQLGKKNIMTSQLYRPLKIKAEGKQTDARQTIITEINSEIRQREEKEAKRRERKMRKKKLERENRRKERREARGEREREREKDIRINSSIFCMPSSLTPLE